ncbi:MAG: hypothetical protein PHC56_05070 [Herbinix sp.]|nr:hypothetical protein [Herbinix sp.]
MSISEFVRKQLMNYFIIVTILTLVIAILGLIYEPNQSFGYEAYFSPLLFGLIAVIPSLVTYSTKELSLKQSIMRKIFQLLLIEAMILSFSHIVGILKSEMIGSMILSILIIFVAVHLIEWIINNKNAKKLTLKLKAFQNTISNHDENS